MTLPPASRSPLALLLLSCVAALCLSLPAGVCGQTVELGWYTDPFANQSVGNGLPAANSQAANDLHCNPLQQWPLPAAGLQLYSFNTAYLPSSVPASGPRPVVRMAIYQVGAGGTNWTLLAGTQPGSDIPLPHSTNPNSLNVSSSGPLYFPLNAASPLLLLPNVTYSLCFSNTATNLTTAANMFYWSNGGQLSWAYDAYFISQPLPNPFPYNGAQTQQTPNVWQIWITAGPPMSSSSAAPPLPGASSSSSLPIPPLPSTLAAFQPSSSSHGICPYYLIAAEQSTAGVSIFAWDYDFYLQQTPTPLYAINSSGAVVNLAYGVSGLAQFYFETRPQQGRMWIWTVPYGDDGYSTDNSARGELVCYNQSSLAVISQWSFLYDSNFSVTPAMTNGYGNLVTDSQGSIYLALASQVYVISPLTGLQTGYFTVPNYDNDTAISFNLGYFVALDPADVLWVVDGNQLPNLTYAAFRMTTAGALINSAFITLPLPTAYLCLYCQELQSFAVDSAGTGWIVLYGSRLIYKVDSSFTVTTLPVPGPTPPALHGYDFEVSISWGSAPAQDLLYLYDATYRPDVFVMSPAGALLSTINTDHNGMFYPAAFSYDGYQGSFLVSAQIGLHSAYRVSSQQAVTQQFDLGFGANAWPTEVLAIAGDGLGFVAMAGLAPDGVSGELWFFQQSALTWNATVGAGTAVAVDGVNQRVYVPSAASSASIQAYSYSGALTATVSAPQAAATPVKMLYRLTSAGGALVQCDGATSVLTSVLIATGAATTLFAGDPAVHLAITDFAFSPDGQTLYAAGSSDQFTGSRVFAVSLATGRVFGQFNTNGEAAGLVAVNAADGSVWLPVGARDLQVFAPAALGSSSSSSTAAVAAPSSGSSAAGGASSSQTPSSGSSAAGGVSSSIATTQSAVISVSSSGPPRTSGAAPSRSHELTGGSALLALLWGAALAAWSLTVAVS